MKRKWLQRKRVARKMQFSAWKVITISPKSKTDFFLNQFPPKFTYSTKWNSFKDHLFECISSLDKKVKKKSMRFDHVHFSTEKRRCVTLLWKRNEFFPQCIRRRNGDRAICVTNICLVHSFTYSGSLLIRIHTETSYSYIVPHRTYTQAEREWMEGKRLFDVYAVQYWLLA